MKTVIFLLFLFLHTSFSFGNDIPPDEYYNELSLTYGFPDLAGFKYQLNIRRFYFGVKPGLLSWIYGQFSDRFDNIYTPSLYASMSVKRHKGRRKGYVDHLMELGTTPFFDTYKDFRFNHTMCSSLRYVFVKTNNQWRYGFSAGLGLWFDFEPPERDVPTMHFPFIPLPSGYVQIGRFF